MLSSIILSFSLTLNSLSLLENSRGGGNIGESLGLGRGLLENSRGGNIGESLGLGTGLLENSRGGGI